MKKPNLKRSASENKTIVTDRNNVLGFRCRSCSHDRFFMQNSAMLIKCSRCKKPRAITPQERARIQEYLKAEDGEE